MLLRRTIPSDIYAIVGAQLDAFCKRTEWRSKSRQSDSGRFLWRRRGRAIILAEEQRDISGNLIRRDSGKFVYHKGEWHLYYLDAAGRWRRYELARPAQSFAVAFRHWREDVTGIFQSPRIRRSTESEIEREALAVLVGG
ncbi:MAG: hypothetical protein ACOY5B_08455 [Spirochaetota bacterium]